LKDFQTPQRGGRIERDDELMIIFISCNRIVVINVVVVAASDFDRGTVVGVSVD